MNMTAKDLARLVGVPLELAEHEPVRRPVLLTLRTEVGGQPITFNQKEELAYLAGEPINATEWLQLRAKLDHLFMHAGAIKKAPEPNKSQPASNFLTTNLKWINEAKVGKIVSPPSFVYSTKKVLDGLIARAIMAVLGLKQEDYSGVIGKEEVEYAD